MAKTFKLYKKDKSKLVRNIAHKAPELREGMSRYKNYFVSTAYLLITTEWKPAVQMPEYNILDKAIHVKSETIVLVAESAFQAEQWAIAQIRKHHPQLKDENFQFINIEVFEVGEELMKQFEKLREAEELDDGSKHS